MQGNLKNHVIIENRRKRYASLLWEFWKKDYELFPDEIINKDKVDESNAHAMILVFDGSTEDVPNSQEEIDFYKKIMKKAKNKGYKNPFVILTKIDLVEQKLRKQLAKNYLTKKQLEDEVRIR